MDLDNIKKTWLQADLSPRIGEDKILKMLDNKGQAAFRKLLKFEMLGLIASIICMPLSLIFKETPICIFYFSSVVLIFFWQIYKYRFLKRIDLTNMGILDISQTMIRYRKYLFVELIIAVIWVVVFALMSYFLVFHKADMALYGGCSTRTIVFIAVLIILPLLVAGLGYRFMYLSNIKKLEESIKEIEYFEKEV